MSVVLLNNKIFTHPKNKLVVEVCNACHESTRQSDILELQKDLIALEEWEKTWGMSFHPDKCNIMRVTRSKNPILFNCHLKGHQLVAADTTKYLGVDLSLVRDYRGISD